MNEGHKWESTNTGRAHTNEGQGSANCSMNEEHEWSQGQMRAGTAHMRAGGAQVQGFIISI